MRLPMLKLALAIALFSSLSHATNLCVRVFTQLSYHNDYVCFECPTNVLSLIDRAKNAGIDPKEIDVVFISDFQRPLHYRDFLGASGWPFHVIATHKGQVMDFDFSEVPSEAIPKVLPVEQYVTTQFGPLSYRDLSAKKSVGDTRIRIFDGQYYYDHYGRSIEDAEGNNRVADHDYFWRGRIGDRGREMTIHEWIQSSPWR
jgi:hypothetical protein